MQFLEKIREVQFYGYVRLDPCICDYPEVGCSAEIYAGNNEINCCIKLPTNQTKEVSFKINRLRSWQVTFLVSTLAEFVSKFTFSVWKLRLSGNGKSGEGDSVLNHSHLSIFLCKPILEQTPLAIFSAVNILLYINNNWKPSSLTLLSSFPGILFMLFLPLSILIEGGAGRAFCVGAEELF